MLYPGVNDGITPPTILSVSAGTVSGTAGKGQMVEIFVGDSSECASYVGTITAGTTGNFSFPLPTPIALPFVSATATDTAGNTSELSRSFRLTDVSRGPGSGLPADFTLFQNYPNPFNPMTTIRYGLPHRSEVTLTVFNVLGEGISELVEGVQEAGYHEVKFDASGLSSGVYFYRIRAGNFVQTRKLLLLR